MEQRQEQATAERAHFSPSGKMEERELVEFLRLQAYYERRAAEFIGRWLADTPERDAFVLLARQVEDEAMHYQLHMRALARRGVTSLDGWKLEPEWEEWIDVWYPSGADTIERVAAHNVTGEVGAYTAFSELRPHVPADVRANFDRILPDERFHMRLGQIVLERHCVSDDQQERARARALRTLELQEAARYAFNRRMARLGLANERATATRTGSFLPIPDDSAAQNSGRTR